MDQDSEDRKFLRTLAIGVVSLVLLITAVFVTTFLLSGQEDKSGTAIFQQTVPTVKAGQPAGPATKNIKVREGEMFIRLSSNQAKAGQVTFSTRNIGSVVHELAVLKTDKPAADLGGGSKAPENGKVGEVANLSPGQSKSLSINLTPGHYALICNLPGHYSAGMYADLNVVK